MRSLSMLLVVVITSLLLLTGCQQDQIPAPSSPARIPVILDTDTGGDIDDTFAIAMLLRSPQFDIKLITTTDGQSDHRAALIAKLLTAAGRTDIPIGKGAAGHTGTGRLASWVKDFDLSAYKGKIEEDGVQSLIDTVNHSSTPITIIAIGPLQTLAAALDRDPSIAARANLVGMQGSVFKGYNGAANPQPEFNVKQSIPSAKKVLSAPWRRIAITPLDTCGLPQIRLTGDRLAALKNSTDSLAQAVLQAHAVWSKVSSPTDLKETSLLYDTVAIYLADRAHPLLTTRPLKITVTDTGMTAVSDNGTTMDVATDWTDVQAYQQYLTETLTARH